MTRTAMPKSGLYAITDSSLHRGEALERAVARAIDGGAAVIQYRDKSNDRDRRHAEATRLLRICRRRCVPLIVNDDVDLALTIEADGVHVGREDAEPATIRARVGEGFVIGVSCYDEPERAVEAERKGADYVAFGAVFPSTTKPGARRVDIATVLEARARVHLPMVAIGGITPRNAAALLRAGVDMLAVVRGVFASADPAVAAREYRQLFEEYAQEVET